MFSEVVTEGRKEAALDVAHLSFEMEAFASEMLPFAQGNVLEHVPKFHALFEALCKMLRPEGDPEGPSY